MNLQNAKSVEGYTLFPYIAWMLFIGFALYAAYLATELQTVTEQIETNTSQIQLLLQENSSAAEVE